MGRTGGQSDASRTDQTTVWRPSPVHATRLPSWLHARETAGPHGPRSSPTRRRSRARQIVTRFGAADVTKKTPSGLSRNRRGRLRRIGKPEGPAQTPEPADVPRDLRAVGGSRVERRPVTTEDDAESGRRMPPVRFPQGPRREVPDTDRPVVGCRGEHLAVRAEGNSAYPTGYPSAESDDPPAT